MSDLQEQRDEIAQQYFDLLPFDPYPVQEEALLAWFTSDQGTLVCAPTGTGKTLIAEAAIYEALKLDKKIYYTTPLIALTDQKFNELRESVKGWGFSPDEVGLVTGNRKVNPDAKVLVVVAEILLNRLLQPTAFDFNEVWAVVMDEFHSFNDPERGIVWEFGLSLLPSKVRTMLLSATVGNSMHFNGWLRARHNRNLQLVESHERKVPLNFRWTEDQLLDELVEEMVQGEGDRRMTPALIFCFNREQSWTIAEFLKGKKVVNPEQQKALSARLSEYDWSEGAGPKLKQILQRGLGVHHAGVLPRYRRIVETLFQEKLLSFCVCTETLAAGINLPARSVVLPTILKGPPGKMKVIEPSSAHQMFGRAGRPQYDDCGYVYVLPHEDDVKLQRWKKKYDQIPEDSKDPGLRKAKKALKKKMPKRRDGVQYWSQQQFEKLVESPPADLASRGPLPWRMLVYMLDLSPDVQPIRELVAGRLLDDKAQTRAQKQLDKMLMTLYRGGYVNLEPKPNLGDIDSTDQPAQTPETENEAQPKTGLMLDLGQRQPPKTAPLTSTAELDKRDEAPTEIVKPVYKAEAAEPTEKLEDLLLLKGIHPLYGLFLMNHLGIADRTERIMAMESLLELPRSLGKAVRIPKHEDLPPGPLATDRLDPQLLKLGLASAEELGALPAEDQEEDRRGWYDDDFVPILTLPHKLQRLFQHDFPTVDDLRVWPCWVAGEVLTYNGEFNTYITSNKLQKQEGMIFRHLLRMVLLLDEFAMLCPPDIDKQAWQDELAAIADQLEETCRRADSYSTDQWLDESRGKE